MRRLVIFGGSFDPIHYGHLKMAEEASSQLDADVVFVPNSSSPWKEGSADPEDKYAMVVLATQGKPRFSVSRREIEHRGPDYSIDTVRYFHEKEPDSELYFLIGGDQVERFDNWKDADEFTKYCQIAYYGRPGFAGSDVNIKKYTMVPIVGEQMAISSSEIRALHNLETPFPVIHYIQNDELYYMDKVAGYIDGKRFIHSKSVALLSYSIAERNGLDRPWRAYIAGLLHDIGKVVSDEEAAHIEADFPEYMPLGRKLYHQFLSARIAQQDFGINDPDILEAIRYHATGKPEMGDIGKIVYASDKIDPTRGYDSSDMINACLNDLKKGFVYVLSENRKHLLSKGLDISNKLTSSCFEYYLDKDK